MSCNITSFRKEKKTIVKIIIGFALQLPILTQMAITQVLRDQFLRNFNNIESPWY